MKYLPLALIVALASAPTAMPAPAAAKDTVTLGVAVEPPHLDPSSHVAGSIREIVYANVFEGLMLTMRRVRSIRLSLKA